MLIHILTFFECVDRIILCLCSMVFWILQYTMLSYSGVRVLNFETSHITVVKYTPHSHNSCFVSTEGFYLFLQRQPNSNIYF